PDLPAAQRSALDELIERDATMIWWHSGSPAIGIEPDSIPGWRELTETRRPVEGLEFIPVWIPNRFDAPVLGVTAVDHQLGTVSFGAACRAEPIAALKKALIEGAQLRGYAHGLLDPQGGVWTAVSAGMLDASVYKPWREDRRYTESYRADYRDLTDLGCHSQYYLDPAAHHYAARLTRPDQHCRFDDIPALADAGRSGPDAHVRLLRRHGFQTWCVDVTTLDVAVSGLRVVRMLVPGLYPNAPAAFPFVGGRRLYREPREQGWLDRTLTFSDLEFAPLPHS
ncbi:MAG: YcaO-like family protein, partial [Wenzhouxiangellaceae bacterium]